GHREPLHLQACRRGGVHHHRGEGLEVLQPVELAGPEFARGERSLYHYFHDGGRKALDLVHGGEQLAGERSEELGWRTPRLRRRFFERARHHRVALARRSERLDDIAEVGRVQVAEEADETPIGKTRQAFAERDPLLERFLDFLVIERIRRAVDEAAPVRDGDAAPVPKKLDDARGPAFARGKGPFLAYRARMREELLGDLALLVVPF